MNICKFLKRSLSLLLVLMMCVGLMSLSAFAANEETPSLRYTCNLEEHTHSEECYETNLICGLEESEGHTHGEDCYESQTVEETQQVLTCDLEEAEGHQHTEECYNEVKTLTCGLDESEATEDSEGHTHSDECYQVTSELTCGKELSEGHTHTEDCYTTEPVEVEKEVLICDLEESEGHQHTNDCYETTTICGLEEHTHGASCEGVKVLAGTWEQFQTAIASGYEVVLDDDFVINSTITISRDTTLDLNGHTISLNGAVGAMFQVTNGNFTITSTAGTNGTLQGPSGNVSYSGSSVTYTGTANTAALIVMTGGNLNITNTTLTGNVNGGTGSKKTSLWMDNDAEGGAIRVVPSETVSCNVTIGSGAVITGNGSLAVKPDETKDQTPGGGGISFCGKGTLTINGGEISNNVAAGGGGGISIRISYKNGDASAVDLPHAKLAIYGGSKLNGNIALSNEGGAIRTEAKEGVIDPNTNSGDIEIKNNKTFTTFDLGGGGIFIVNTGSMTIHNAVVTSNTANGLGGGIAGCIHGSITNNATQATTAAIYSNTANGTANLNSVGHSVVDGSNYWNNKTKFINAGDDLFCDGFITIGTSSLGGGTASWEGYTCDKNKNLIAVSTALTNPIEASGAVALHVTNPDSVAAAVVNNNGNKVHIEGNTSAMHGGGIATNGLLKFGDASFEYSQTYFTLDATKELVGCDAYQLAQGEFTFQLSRNQDGSEPIAIAANDANGNICFKFSISGTDAKKVSGNQYTFTAYLSEVNSGAGDVSYDQSVYKVVLTFNRTSSDTETKKVGQNTITVTAFTDVLTNVAVTKVVDKDSNTTNTNVNATFVQKTWTETDDDGNKITTSGYAITLDSTAKTFTNTLLTGSLSIGKKLAQEDEADYNTDWTFTVTFTGDRVLSSYPYTVSGETEAKTLTVENGVGTITLKAGQTAIIEGIPNGTGYTVSETAGNYYDTTFSGVNGTIATDNTSKAEFTNTIKRGDISVTKLLNLDGSDVVNEDFAENEFTFAIYAGQLDGSIDEKETVQNDLTVNGWNNPETEEDETTGTWKNLRYGWYTIVETSADVEDYHGWRVNYGTDVTEVTVTIDGVEYNAIQVLLETNGQEIAVDATNSYDRDLGELSISKTVQGDLGDRNREWNFTVTLTTPKEYVDLLNPAYEYTYTITTKDNQGNDVYEYKYQLDEDGNPVLGEDGNPVLVVDENGNPVVKVYTLKQVVEEDPEEPEQPAEVEEPEQSEETEQPEESAEPVSVIYAITLKHGQTAHIVGIPVGTTYEVTEAEANKDGYSTSTTDNTGVIVTSATEAKFYNSRWSVPTTSLTVNKVWDDEGHEDERPDSIQVQLYRNGNAYGNPVTLNADNGWSQRWTGLSTIGTWTVEELNVPHGYTMTMEQSGTVVTITNTYEEEEDEDEELDDPDVPLAEMPDDPEEPDDSDDSDNSDGPDEEFLDDPDVPLAGVPDMPEEEELDDPDVPLAEMPGAPEEEELDEPDVPLVEMPDAPEEEELTDLDVPLAEVPKTGDRSGLWYALSAAAAAGLLGLTAVERKKREED